MKGQENQDKYLLNLANKLNYLLNNDEVSPDVKAALCEIVNDMANEGNIGISSPEIVGLVFPNIIKSVGLNYGRGIVAAITAILNSSLIDENIAAELNMIHDETYQQSAEIIPFKLEVVQ